MDSLGVGIVSAIFGFAGGLITPWVRWEVEKRRRTRSEKASLIKEWRQKIDEFDFENEILGDSVWYSSLRSHMKPDVIEKVEKPRTVYVGGGRGEQVIKHMLLDEVARLEKEIWSE